MTTLSQFAKSADVTMTAEPWHENPYMCPPFTGNHWRCVLRMGRRRMTIYFSQGTGYNGNTPELPSVLNCLASDSAGLVNASYDFGAWCREYGYDEDSRKAETTFNAIARQAKRLKRFLGDSAYDTLLFHTDPE
jgi:hypothetical protein